LIRFFDHFIIKPTFFIIVCVLIVSSGCYAPPHEGFAIYLTKDDIPPAQMEALSHVDLTEQPVISINDIITYNAQTHEMKLTESAFERISQMNVPVRGKSFMVCVDKKPVYWGAFWTPASSISFNGVTIWTLHNSQGPKVITLELGYPSSSFYGGGDPRNNPEVMRSLDQAGKLITQLSISSIDRLPHSMKGYELYSWSEDGKWNFTLITGTNRNKSLEEIVADGDYISEAGWVHIHVVGVEAIESVISKLPQKEEILWLSGWGSDKTQQDGRNITLPPASTISVITDHASRYGLAFQIQSP
jgi:hypothetical protein